MTDQERILQFLKQTGPTLPSKVAKSINSNILLASAHLSDLSSQRKVKISKLKIGGSPLYYLPGQEEQLFHFAAGNVNPKDYDVLQTLKTKKVLREANLDLLYKVALRSLKDFAVPIHVTIDNKKELFWRWHLLQQEETNGLVAGLLGIGQKEEVKEEISDETGEVVQESEQELSLGEPTITVEAVPSELEIALGELREKEEEAREILEEKEREESAKKIVEKARKAAEQKTLVAKNPVLKKIKEKIKRIPTEDVFFPEIQQFFQKNNIAITEKETVRKSKEIDFLVRIPSGIGETTYFCKTKKKKRCDEKDISAAYMEAQIKKLPLLFLYSGEINKKAQEMLDSGTFQNTIVKKIE
jgi:hypothetical protein